MTNRDESVIPYEGRHSEDDLELFGRFRELHRIIVEGRPFHVPAQNVVLRACQHIEMYERALRMPWRDYCWNNTEGCCEMTYKETAAGPEIVGRACRVLVKPDMEIVRLPKGGRSCTPRK